MTLNIELLQNIDTKKIWFFRFKKFQNWKYLLTNDAGKFHFFSEVDFEAFLRGQVENMTEYQELIAKWFIKNASYEARMTGSVALKNHFVWMWPSLHIIITTLRCNHKCKYCHAAVAPMTAIQFDMTEDLAKKVVDTIFYTNSPHITIEFQWGESLVNYPIVQFITEYATIKAQHLKKLLTLNLVSNLTLLTEEKLTWLLDHGVDICTSLDGNHVTHNANRTGYDGNSYEVVTYWMKRVSEEKQKRGMWKIGALLTVTKETLPKYKEIIDTYISLWLDGIFLRWLNPYGFAAAEMDTLAYEDDDWIEFYKKSLDYILEINKQGILFRESITSVYLMKIFNAIDPGYMDVRSPSGLWTGCVAYNYDGKIYASDESRMLGRMGIDDFLMTHITENPKHSYTSMMKSDIVQIATQSSCLDGLPGYNDHIYKPYIGVDIIHNFKMTGNIYVPLVKDKKIKLQIAVLDYIFEKLQNPDDEKILKSWI